MYTTHLVQQKTDRNANKQNFTGASTSFTHGAGGGVLVKTSDSGIKTSGTSGIYYEKKKAG